MVIIKRDGSEVDFDSNKIKIAIQKANTSVDENDKISESDIDLIVSNITKNIESSNYIHNVEDIQNLVEESLFKVNKFKLAKNYITYRYLHNLNRENNEFLNITETILNHKNEEVEEENANKNPAIISTQRDYIAGEVNKMYSRSRIYPADIIKAHDEGLIHIHDLDYIAMKTYNCSLINIDDMLQNGTIISNSYISKPKSFTTACNVTTQIMAQVASQQYGGQTVNVHHISKFVDVSRQKFIKNLTEELNKNDIKISKNKFNALIKDMVSDEIKKGVQMIQYQINTLQTTNGQAPFASLFIYFNEAEPGTDRDDLVLVTKEILKQRIKGIQNKVGAWVAPSFPKILYVLDTTNCNETTPYWEVTKLAAECTSKRMVPDYISEKVMKSLKDGNVFGCMGCLVKDELVTYKLNDLLYVESIGRMWRRIANLLGYGNIKPQFDQKGNPNKYIDTTKLNLKIYDTLKNKFVKVNCLNRNISKKFMDVVLSGGRVLTVTDDHIFTTSDGKDVKCKDLTPNMSINVNYSQYSEEKYDIDSDFAWFLGMLITNSSYDHQLTISIAEHGEDDIQNKIIVCAKKFLNATVDIIIRHRGKKGNCKDLKIKLNESEKISNEMCFFRKHLVEIFGGKEKVNRSIPNFVFSSLNDNKLSMLAGMIDGDGYLNKDLQIIQLESTNKELVLQQMALAQSLNMPSKIYKNHYDSNNKSKIRYRIEFHPSKELNDHIICNEKKSKFNESVFNYKISKESNVVSVEKNELVLNNEKWQYSYDVTTESEHFGVSGVYSHNCRSFLSVWKDSNGNPKFWGRFNKGVVTLNLPDVALTIRDKYGENAINNSEAMKEFWNLLDNRLELIHKALLIRAHYLEGTVSDVAPILWQDGALARLKPGEKIDSLLKGGYSTISLGYVGIYETVMALTGKSNTDSSNYEFGLSVVKHLNEKCTEWNNIPNENYGFSLYGTPEESLTYKFSKALIKRHGKIEGITDKLYVVNSYHVDPRENIDAFNKLKFESEFQKYTTGGAISYIETPNLVNNQEAILSVIKFIYDNIWYAELNCKLDYCQKCGYDGEIKLVKNKNNKWIWKCPNCGNEDINSMNIVRRVCGYLSNANAMNQGRKDEIAQRVLHL